MPSAKKAPASAKKAAPPAKKAAQAATAKAAPAKQATKASKAAKEPAGDGAAKAKAAPKKEPAAKKATPAKAAKKSTKATKADAAPPPEQVDGSPFPPEFLEQQRAALLDERATYLRQAESLRAEADALVADFEPGDVQFDEESGEGDTISVERERDLALSASARAILEEIDRALAKLDTGTYGICEVSGQPIPAERLEAIPWARERVEYKTGGLGRR
ncbi:MAG TPA: TraR/DksA C4-type zinc finger protein [Acidimicrobiales bacterium]|jgi:RNA polymerase-binding transcription factor DksA